MKEFKISVHHLHFTHTYSSGLEFKKSATMHNNLFQCSEKCTLLSLVLQYKHLNNDCYDFIVQITFQKFHR
jgi:hypothetical protein